MPHDSATKWQHGITTVLEHSEHGKSPTSAVQEQAYAHTLGRPQRGQPQMRVVIGVQGKEFALGTPTDMQIAKALDMARVYGQCLFRAPPPGAVLEELMSALARLRVQFSRQEAERIALADAAGFEFTDAQMQRDIEALRRLGSLSALIRYHNEKQKETGMNEYRIRTHLADDVEFPKLLDIVQNGAVVDTDPAFVRTERQAPLLH